MVQVWTGERQKQMPLFFRKTTENKLFNVFQKQQQNIQKKNVFPKTAEKI